MWHDWGRLRARRQERSPGRAERREMPAAPGSVDVHHPADDEQIMHMSATLWAALVDWVKAGFGDYERLPDDPRKHLPIFRG